MCSWVWGCWGIDQGSFHLTDDEAYEDWCYGDEADEDPWT
jgi:hypothetical protein